MSRSKTNGPFDDPETRRRLADLVAAGAFELGVPLSPETRDRMLAYLALLHRWNRAYSLTAVRDPEQMVIRLLLDSLSVVPYIKGPHVLDIGSGPGLPGVPLAIADPGLAVVLLDSSGKKTRFQQHAIGELGLGNVTIEQSRVEQYMPSALFDSVVSRAFVSLAVLVTAGGRLCRPGGELLAMKGRYPETELSALPPDCRVLAVERLRVPGLDAERYLVRLAGGPEGPQ